jgi:rfaE bifunctional protein kinase chain/domain
MMAGLERARLETILEQIHHRRVGVVGDFVLDGYWYADMTRAQLSREAPLFNRPVVTETYSPGGAANVAWNLADLGVGEVHAISILGADWRGSLLRDIFQRLGVRCEALLERPAWKTPFYGKVILTGWDTRQEDARLDMINPQPLEAADEDLLTEALRQAVPALDALIIADYIPQGVVTRRVRAALLELAERYPQVVFLADSRERIAHFKSLVIKPNAIEASQLFFPERPPAEGSLEALEKAALELNARTKKPVYITLGDQGCLLCEMPHAVRLPAVSVAPPLDPVGAGDTFLASLGAGLAAGATTQEAGCLANLAAAVTIQKIGMTGTASPHEILALYEKQANASLTTR